jgi:L-lactate dehydrogenase complex protein LldE
VRIAILVTCLNDALFPAAGAATAGVLRRLGHEPVFPSGQTCCGQMHWNSGYRREAVGLIRRTVATLAPYEVVVCPSGSCTAMIREHYARAAVHVGDAGLSAAVEALGNRVFELSELLIDRLGVEDVGAELHARAVYHPTCHSLRGLRVGDRPYRLLRAVKGLELVELERAEECCGFGGTFAVKNPETSAAMGEDKAAAVEASGADVLIAGDRSCLMHIGGVLSRGSSRVRTLHLAEVLAAGGSS